MHVRNVVCAAAIILLAFQSALAQAKLSSEKLDKDVVNASLQGLDGKLFKLADYNGKVLVLVLWATWSAPCHSAMTDVNKLNKRYAKRNVQIVGLDIEEREEEGNDARAFAATLKLKFKLGWAKEEIAAKLLKPTGAVPQLFVLTPSGQVATHFIGYNPNETYRRLSTAIDQALSFNSESH